MLVDAIMNNNRATRLATGIYLASNIPFFNAGMYIDDETIKDEYTPYYGVCDHPIQILKKRRFRDVLNLKRSRYCIFLLPVFKEDQPEDGGWRWSKWGEYIGTFDHKMEYLYDEVGIEYVIPFSLIELNEYEGGPKSVDQVIAELSSLRLNLT